MRPCTERMLGLLREALLREELNGPPLTVGASDEDVELGFSDVRPLRQRGWAVVKGGQLWLTRAGRFEAKVGGGR